MNHIRSITDYRLEKDIIELLFVRAQKILQQDRSATILIPITYDPTANKTLSTFSDHANDLYVPQKE